ncbi:MAG TPA: hypothetical protein VJ260_02510 [Vicinamibacterales bacterium]|nr:hypothetical protein [Vicinamibacterales bacterium]
MFLGHYALGFGAKKLTPYTSLGTLLLGAELVDLLWPTFLMLGVETVRVAPGITRVTPLDFTWYPWTHSLVMGAVWAGVFAALYAFFRRYPRGATVLAALVLSHWLLDVISHRPDMPIWPGGGPTIGLGLWYSLPATLVVEGVLFSLGIWIYATNTEPVDTVGRYSFPAFVITLAAVYLASVFGPPPPSASAIAVVGQGQWLLVMWGYWLDRHRVAIRQW